MKAAHRWIGAVMLVTAWVAQAGDGWQVQVGGVQQWGLKMATRGPALTTAHNYSVPPHGLPPQDGAGAGLADPDYQTFVDGYVRRDVWMDVPGVPAIYQTMTWNWSCNRFADQYQNDDQTLAFHRQTAATTSSTGADDFSAAGVAISARHDLWHARGFDVGLDLGLAWFPHAEASQRRALASRFNTYYFSDDLGVVPGLRELGPGYQGPDYQGPNFDNPDTRIPHLNYTPVRITDTLEQTTVSTKAELYRVRGGVGPTLQVRLTDQLRLYVAPQLTLSLARAQVQRTQTQTTTCTTTLGAGDNTTTGVSDEISNDKTACLAGFLLATGVDYTFADNWFVGAYLGHEWVANALAIHVGPDKTRLELSGGELACYVGLTF